MRLHELAHAFGADSKRLLQIARELGLGIKTHSSNIPRGAEGILRAAWVEELEELMHKACVFPGVTRTPVASHTSTRSTPAAPRATASGHGPETTGRQRRPRSNAMSRLMMTSRGGVLTRAGAGPAFLKKRKRCHKCGETLELKEFNWTFPGVNGYYADSNGHCHNQALHSVRSVSAVTHDRVWFR